MPKARCDCKTVVINSELFVLGGYYGNNDLNDNDIKFCNKSRIGSSTKQINLDKEHFSACSFINNLYLACKTGNFFVYNFKNNYCTELSNMNETRYNAACTVFEIKIVVTGGEYTSGFRKSVEAYDYYENKWTYLPDMIKVRHYHASVSMGNKLFVVGGYNTSSCEVFDSYSRKYTLINLDIINSIDTYNFKAVCLGNKILVFATKQFYQETKLFIYDVINDSWSETKITVVNSLIGSSYTKYTSD